jgi:hypothetical protein
MALQGLAMEYLRSGRVARNYIGPSRLAFGGAGVRGAQDDNEVFEGRWGLGAAHDSAGSQLYTPQQVLALPEQTLLGIIMRLWPICATG